ncbi:MAG TPA: NAD(P)-binding domain-containing protein, partial [Bacillota bacterium]|nr:NAD(P)-binding domain-containing protein [Bacillota bacterium]
MKSVAMIGAGSWATALAVLLAKKGIKLKMWARRQEQVDQLLQDRENKQYLPGILFPDTLTISSDLEETVAGTEAIILGVPSHAVRGIASQIAPLLREQQIIVNTAKGLEQGTMLRLSQVLVEELPAGFADNIVVLSGPSHAEEVARDIPTTIVVAASCKRSALVAQDLFMTPAFRVYTNRDLIGVELGG